MHSVLILTISGRDRKGLVEQLASVVAEFNGNWEICRMAHLAGHFVGLLQITVPGDQQQEVEVAIRSIKELDVMISAGEVSDQGPPNQFQLEIVGGDHPGIVRDIFTALAAAKVNVEELATSTEAAPDSGVLLFKAKARLSGADADQQLVLREELERIASDIMVDVHL